MFKKHIYLLFAFLFSINLFGQKAKVDSLETILEQGRKVEKIEALLSLSLVYKNDSTLKAEKLLREAYFLSNENKIDTLIVKTANLLGPILLKLNKKDEAKKLYENALALSQKSTYIYGKASTLNHLASFYLSSNILDSALIFYKQSAEIFEASGNLKYAAQIFNNIGIVYYKQVNFEKSIEYFIKSLEIKEQTDVNGNRIASDAEIVASSINIGLFYYKLKKYNEAIQYLRKAESISKKINHSNYLSQASVNMGAIYNTMEKYDSALYYHTQALQLAEKMNNSKRKSQCYTGMANVYTNLLEYEKAIDYFLKSLEMHLAVNDKRESANIERSLASLYLDTKQLKLAEKHAENGLKLALTSKNKEIEQSLNEVLAQIYEKQHKYPLAYKHFVRYTQISDSIESINNQKNISEIQIKYETEKKNNKIKELKIENINAENTKQIFQIIAAFLLVIALILFIFYRQRIRSNNILQKLNNTQNKLISIISHDFKAPLSAFYSITNALKNKKSSLTNEEIDHFLDRMLNSSIALKLQLENMLNWAIAQSHEIVVNNAETNLQITVFKTIMILQEFANEKGIKIKENIPEDIHIQTDGKLLSIVINNLISNAIKFSNENSEIIIATQNQEKKIILTVTDFGKGMDTKKAETLFLSKEIKKNNEKERGTGLGLLVCKEIIDKLQGEISASSKINKGTVITIKLPL